MKTNILCLDHDLPPLNSKYRNSGPPKKDVTAPMGKITGAITERAAKSPKRSKSAPARTDPGIKYA